MYVCEYFLNASFLSLSFVLLSLWCFIFLFFWKESSAELSSTSRLVERHDTIPFHDEADENSVRTNRGEEEDVGALESESILISGRVRVRVRVRVRG